MKVIKLITLDRLLIQMMLDVEGKSNKHSLSELNNLLKIIDKIRFTEEEAKLLELKNEDGTIKWKVENDKEKDIELSDEQSKILVDIFKKKDTDKAFDLQNFAGWVRIANQIGYEFIK